MKSMLLLGASGALVILTSFPSPMHPALLEKLKVKGIRKFVAFEIPLDLAKQRYGGHFAVVQNDLHESRRPARARLRWTACVSTLPVQGIGRPYPPRGNHRQSGVARVPAGRGAPFGSPGGAGSPQGGIILRPVRDLVLLLRDMTAAILVRFEGHDGLPGSDRAAL